MSTQIVENVSGQVPPPIQPLDSFHAEFEKYVGYVVADFTKNILKDYEIFQPKDVAEYLAENLFLIDLLKESPKHIRHSFGAEQKLGLKVFRDIEDPTWIELEILILGRRSFAKNSPLLEKFLEEWWLDNMNRAKHKLNIKLE